MTTDATRPRGTEPASDGYGDWLIETDRGSVKVQRWGPKPQLHVHVVEYATCLDWNMIEHAGSPRLTAVLEAMAR